MFACDIPAIATLQHEDEAIRITRYDFAPGAVTGWHKHGWPYFVIMLKAGTLRAHNGKEIVEMKLAEGEAYMRQAGIEHDVMNGSDHAIAFVEIEVKRPDALKLLA